MRIDSRLKLNQDQAVLAEIVRQSQDQGSKIGRTALQKILYFLKCREVPLSYSFDLYHYGPFCQEILWDADLTQSLGVIKDKRRSNGGSQYLVGNNFEALINEHQDFLNQYSNEIKAIVELLSDLDAATLEVAATLDYFYRYEKATDRPSPYKQEVLRRFFESKPQYLVHESKVSQLYDQMIELNMVGE